MVCVDERHATPHEESAESQDKDLEVDVDVSSEENVALDANSSHCASACSSAVASFGGEDEEQRDQKPMTLPWSEEELMSAFDQFSDHLDQEVRTDVLPQVLHHLGTRPSDEEVMKLVKEQTKYASMDRSEFVEFIRRYREYDLSMLHEMFNQADKDRSGEVDFKELHSMLVKFKFSPTVEATLEAFEVVDVDCSGTIDFDEFERLREHLRLTHGFMKAEAVELQSLYDRAVGGPKKLLPSEEVWRISTYIGYPASPELVAKLVAEVDRSARGMMNFDELLQVIRAIHDYEIAEATRIMTRAEKESLEEAPPLSESRDLPSSITTIPSFPEKGQSTRPKHVPSAEKESDLRRRQSLDLRRRDSAERLNLARTMIGKTWTMPTDRVLMTMVALGYPTSEELLAELLQGMQHELQSTEYVTIDELSAILNQHRKLEGFTAAEIEELHDAFQREQHKTEGAKGQSSLDALELGRVLRWLGISKPLSQVQRLIVEIDFNSTGQVGFHELKKLMRQLLQAESKRRRGLFYCFDAGGGVMDVADLHEALAAILEAEPDENMIKIAFESTEDPSTEHLTLIAFESVFAAYKKLLVQTVRENSGFVPSEVEALSAVFQRYDRAKTGTVMGTALRRLLADTIPESTKTKSGQREVQRMLQEASPKNQAMLSFSAFLWLMRRSQDRRDELDIAREADVLKKCNFAPDEVEGFRQVFSRAVGWSGDLNFEGLKQLISRVHTLSLKEEEELLCLMWEVGPDRQDKLRFPQFLQFMHTVIEENKAGLLDAARRTVRRNSRPSFFGGG